MILTKYLGQSGLVLLNLEFFYVTSQKPDASTIGNAIRRHRSIENELPWRLDMAFREDKSRIRTGYAAKNFAAIRHIAFILLKQEIIAKAGIKIKRSKAGWDDNYLAKVLSGGLN